ncbi:cytochrome b [Methylophaga sp. OBS4]|uniref:cytochrome b n=1 Tax=Methylophaga sp. OBS4 TaxID=2991935 RepID=UPI002257F0E5|nr:cytochrome b [Methylophaga sp. OBS4]MCX4186261.1 cytochrome b [Methylophaga sp. OBS4]
MRSQHPATRYDLFSILLHWLIAVITIGLFASGIWMVELGYYDTWYYRAPWWHKSLGVAIFMLVVVRWLWGLFRATPPPIPSISQWQRILAKSVHGMMSLFILLLGFSGYLIVTAKGDGLSVFDWFKIPAFFTGNGSRVDLAGTVHLWLGYLIIACAVFHALAALKHHFIDKDTTLKRMLYP